MAKLAGIRKAVDVTSNERDRAGRNKVVFYRDDAEHYFKQAVECIDQMRALLPDLYADFPTIAIHPTVELTTKDADGKPNLAYGREQLTRLVRDIDHAFEIRANSGQTAPSLAPVRRVFVSHGRAPDWREVQLFIEKDLQLDSLELAQEASGGQTIIEKLEANSRLCDAAVIVMTGDDSTLDGESRARENVIHEIGYFQGKYGRAKVCLLHEDGISIPTNIAGIVYIPFPKGNISAGFSVLAREIRAMYK